MSDSGSIVSTPPAAHDRWWITALIAGVISFILIGLVIAWPTAPLTLMFGGAAVVFAVVMYFNPRHWLKRRSGACLGIAGAAAAVPAIAAGLDLPEGWIKFSTEGSPWVAGFFGLFSLGFAWLDRNTPSVEVERSLSRIEDNQREQATKSDLDRLESKMDEMLANKPPAGEDPTIAHLTDEQKALVQDMLERGDAEAKAKAAILARDFAAADRYLAQAITPVLEQAHELATLQGDRFYYAGEFDRAIEPYETALRLAPDSTIARARHNLALALMETQVADATGNLLRAIDLYREILKEWTRERDPLGWAGTQNNLGLTLCTLGEREFSTERLEEAVAAFRKALKEFTRERVPLDWAMTQNNLGLALCTLGERESSTDRLEEAITAFREALKEYTRERVPLQWAMTQNNLGHALARLGERESSTDRLEEAIAAFREALKEYTRERVPLKWAMTQNNLGNALQAVGERESSTERLEEAITAYRAALEERTRERVPLDWAMTQNNLGHALARLGERESSTDRLEEAIDAFGEALKEYTRERVPLQWATTQNNLGNALGALGERESSTARLEQAIAAFREALKERTRERNPLQWATTQNNLGTALQTLGERESSTKRLEEAITAYRAALEVFEAAGAEFYIRGTRRNLELAATALERIRNGEQS